VGAHERYSRDRGSLRNRILLRIQCDNASWQGYGVFLSSLVGLVVALLIVYVTDYFTSTKHKPVQDIADAAKTGAGTNVISGLAVGLKSTAPYALIIVAAILLASSSRRLRCCCSGDEHAEPNWHHCCGRHIRPVSDNAGGIAEMSGLSDKIRKVTDKLDAVGNTTKATTKDSQSLRQACALALILAFAQEAACQLTRCRNFDAQHHRPCMLIGLLLEAHCLSFSPHTA